MLSPEKKKPSITHTRAQQSGLLAHRGKTGEGKMSKTKWQKSETNGKCQRTNHGKCQETNGKMSKKTMANVKNLMAKQT